MLRHEVEECKEIARIIAREEILKALAVLFPNTVTKSTREPEVEVQNGPLTEAAVEKAIRSYRKKP